MKGENLLDGEVSITICERKVCTIEREEPSSLCSQEEGKKESTGRDPTIVRRGKEHLIERVKNSSSLWNHGYLRVTFRRRPIERGKRPYIFRKNPGN